MIDESLKRVLGLLDGGKRIYRIYEENEVQQEEFQYCQLMYDIVFGDRGFVETLGPTWNLIHDPRFTTIENQYVIERRAVFGGDARLGKQYINDDGSFSSTASDIEQYADLLGEGRNFHTVLTHPSERCPIRLWLERIYKGYSTIKPHLALKCSCPQDQIVDPVTFKDASDESVWALIMQESPNRAFDKMGRATPYGNFVYNLIRADLIGLIHDYAETPLIDSYIYLRDNGVVVAPEDIQKLDPNGVDHQRVLQEIDILEQALTHRATLRVTAAKILKSLPSFVRLPLEDTELTDLERDELLRIVYTSDWPDNKQELFLRLLEFVGTRQKRTFDERQSMHLEMCKEQSQETIRGLKSGTVLPINHYTEPVKEIPNDIMESEVMYYASVMDSLTQNPLKGWLFSEIYVPAEQAGEKGVLDLLTPIFDPNYDLTEDGYNNLLRAVSLRARSLRAVDDSDVIPRGTADTGISVPKKEVQEIEGKFDIVGQREKMGHPGVWQVQLSDGTLSDTKYPDPKKTDVAEDKYVIPEKFEWARDEEL